MKKSSKIVIHWAVMFVVIGCQLGCATNRQNRWLATGSAVAVGLTVGSTNAPENERKELHAVYWGALLGLGAALISQELFSDAKEIERLTLENQKQSLQLDIIQNANTVLLREGKGTFKPGVGVDLGVSGPIDSKTGARAKWRLYQIDRWVKGSENQLIHQDKLVELIPIENPEGGK